MGENTSEIVTFISPPSRESVLPVLGRASLDALEQSGFLVCMAALKFWENEESESITEAGRAALASLSLTGIIELVDEIEDLVERSCGECDAGHWTGIWQDKPTNLSVDANGTITATIGHTSEMIKVFDREDVAEVFEEDVMLSTFGQLEVVMHYSTISMAEAIVNEADRRRNSRT